MQIEELYSNPGYWTAKIQLELFRSLEEHMKQEGISRAKLAQKMGVSRGYISQILNGDFDHRLSKLVELSLAIGKVPEIRLKELKKTIAKAENNYRTVSWEFDIKDEVLDEAPAVLIDSQSQPLVDVG